MFILKCNPDLLPIVQFIRAVLRIIQMGIPIVLIIMGTIDLGRAVLSSDEKEIKGATSKLIKRAIAAVAVFFISTIVFLLMGLFASSRGENGPTGTEDWESCWSEAA